MRLGDWFRDYYLLPLSGAIWSTPVEKIMDFPAHAMIRFFENHALLNHTGQHQWFTVEGGSVQYVSRLEAAMRQQGVTLRLGVPVAAVRRPQEGGVDLRVQEGEWTKFDEVIFATHSDDSLRLLSDASTEERANLGAVTYQPNAIVLVPTRELAVQVEESFRTYGKYTNLRSTVVYGGVDIKQQLPIVRGGIGWHVHRRDRKTLAKRDISLERRRATGSASSGV